MNIILISFLFFVVIWALGVFAAGYHVFVFRFPGDRTKIYFTGYIITSGILLLFLLDWFFAAYFGG